MRPTCDALWMVYSLCLFYHVTHLCRDPCPVIRPSLNGFVCGVVSLAVMTDVTF